MVTLSKKSKLMYDEEKNFDFLVCTAKNFERTSKASQFTVKAE